MKLILSWVLIAISTCASAQSPSSPSSTPSATSTPVPSSLLSLSAIDFTTSVTAPLTSGGRSIPNRSTVVPTTIHTSEFITLSAPTTTPSSTQPTSTIASTISSGTPTPTAPPVIHLDTRVDPAFGVLGVLLILTGLPSAFLGHKNRWTSFFLIGFYTFALFTLALILKFGVEDAVNPPNVKLKGLFLLACGIAGIVGGGAAILFWNLTKYCIGAWGGLALGFWIQCWRSGGVIHPIGFRWFLYVGCAAIGFVLCTIPKIHYHVLLVATAIVGASAFMLGVDCFTTAGLKEFYVYNLGYSALFPKFANMPFPLSQTMQIELGLMVAVALAGAAVQFRVLTVLQVKLQEITLEHRRRDQELEEKAAARFDVVRQEREEWEKAHGGTPGGSVSVSVMPLMRNGDSSPGLRPNSDIEAGGRPTSSVMGASSINGEYFPPQSGGPTMEPMHERQPSYGPPQSPGPLPSLDLGHAVKDELPEQMISKTAMLDEHPEIKKKAGLLSEIREIRRSIDALSTASFGTKGTHSLGNMDAATKDLESGVAAAATERVARNQRISRGTAQDRDRVKSMADMPTTSTTRPSSTFLASSSKAGESIVRPKSTPLNLANDWETYLAERKLFMPPSGVTAPITPDSLPEEVEEETDAGEPIGRPARSEAVVAALENRYRRESLFDVSDGGAGSSKRRSRRISDLEMGNSGADESSSSGAPLRRPEHSRSKSIGSVGPMTVLPPRPKGTAPTPASPPSPRVLTYEELAERHKAKMRAMQDPLTRAATEEAKLADARSRWEHSKAVESQVMAKKHAEKSREVENRLREEREGRASPALKSPKGQHRPSLSAERLGSMHRPTSSAKVEEWQRYQQQQQQSTDDDTGGGNTSRRRSRQDQGPTSPTSPTRPSPTSPTHRRR